MAGVDALLGCLRLEQYRTALDDAVPCKYSRSKYSRSKYSCSKYSRSSIAVVSPRFDPACYLVITPTVYLLCLCAQGFDDAWFVVVRMSAAQLDELAAAASTAPCGKQPPGGFG
mgnify:CR=1 FL=1